MPLFVLAGYTGSGKTDILCVLHKQGHQVINLEMLAAHNGSVFGHLPHTKSTSSYLFHRALLKQKQQLDWSKPVFCENKAPTLGHLQIPFWLIEQMQKAPAIWLDVKKEIRLQRLLFLYGNTDALSFSKALAKLSNRLNKDQIQNILQAFELRQTEVAFRILMDYYDQGLYYQKDLLSLIGIIEVQVWSMEKVLDEILSITERHIKSYTSIKETTL